MDAASEPLAGPIRLANHRPARGLVVIALGASAGGLHAMEQFLAAVPPDSGLSYVVISHVMPDRVSLLRQVLARATSLPISEIVQGQRPEIDHVYVPPAWAKAKLEGGALHLAPAGTTRERSRRIDYFFESVARELGRSCAGVVLSGGGADGSAGLQAIARTGGLTLVQDPATAKHDSMPRNAIATGVVQHVLAPAAMPALIMQHFPARAEADGDALG
jgi:two-component system CheB/CheR fusion protein